MGINNVLKKPVITERSTSLMGNNQYVVEVDLAATKGQIREAVEALYKVHVEGVRTIRLPGKFRRRFGPKGGYRPDRKKAIIRVKAGQTINWEESKQ